jgi:hypothetical protein
MDRNLKISLYHGLIALVAVLYGLLSGCATIDRSGHYTATVTVRINVVGDRTMYDYPPARNFNSGPAARNFGGYAKNTTPPEIWLTGYRDDHGIRIDNMDTLGHEIMEVLRFGDQRFANPHE